MAKAPTAKQQEQIERALTLGRTRNEDRNRQRFVDALRQQAHRQTRCSLFDGDRVCALGLLIELYLHYTGRPPSVDLDSTMSQALDWVDYTPSQGSMIIRMNDSGVSFPEIARYAERGLDACYRDWSSSTL